MSYSHAQPHPYVQMNPYTQFPYLAAQAQAQAPYPNWVPFNPRISPPQFSGTCNQIWVDSRGIMPFIPTAIPTPVALVQPVPTGLRSATNLPPGTHSPCQFSQFCTTPQPAPAAAFPETIKEESTRQSDSTFSPDDFHSLSDSQLRKSLMDNDNVRRENVHDIEDLVDANFAGSAHSSKCILILTEGRAAMSLAMAGMAVIGRDLYGVYAVKRRLTNVCKSPISEVMKDTEVKNIVDVLGLQFDSTYEGYKELRTLRYGKVLLMIDRDEDGSHMKGLIMNLFYKYWPALLHGNNFLMQFTFPAVKVWLSCTYSGNHELAFHTVEDYENWMPQVEKSTVSKFVSRHYRSIESFTPEEVKEFFSNLDKNCTYFQYEDADDHEALTLAFEKDREGSRKEWISGTMRESFANYEDLKEIRYKDFVNKELLFYSDLQNLRSFPSAIDGLTRSQRKVLHAYFKRHYEQEVGILRLIGSVLDVSAYKQNTDALCQTVINMAQDFVGANNINIFMPIGQFGTRRHGGKDAGKAKYLRTKANSTVKYLFSELDFPILNYRRENDLSIEPFHFLPIIPMVLVNGSDGIGTGWKTKIPKYDSEDIVKNLFHMLDKIKPKNMVPRYKNFKGKIERVDDNQFHSYGEIEFIPGSNQIQITELPIGVWTEAYKGKVLNPMLGESGSILSYEEFHTDTSVNFLVTLRRLDPKTIPEDDLYDMFHLKMSERSHFVTFDHRGLVRDYKNPIQILEEFSGVRLQAYEARKTHMIEKLRFDLNTLEDLLGKVRYSDGNMIMYNLHGEEYNFVYDVRGIQKKEIDSLEKEMIKSTEKLELLKAKSPSDLWREDLVKLCSQLGINVPKSCGVEDEQDEFVSSMNNLRL